MNGKGGKSTGIDPAAPPLNCESDALKYALLPSSIVWKTSSETMATLNLA